MVECLLEKSRIFSKKYFMKGIFVLKKFSIITITYNSEKTLKDTLDSVLNQSYRPLQYILVDGLSTDNTLAIIKEYKKSFDNLGIEFIFVSEKDAGISDAFNKGIHMADGEIIGIINSDDKLCPDALEHIMAAYSDEIGVYYGKCIIFNDHNKDEYVVVPKTDLKSLEKAMPLYHPATFVKKSIYEKYGAFNTQLKYCMDRELLLRFYKNGVLFQYIPKPLAYYREGGVNQMNYKANLREGTRIAIQYGMNPFKAKILERYKYLRFKIWRTIQKLGAESLWHEKIKK